MDETSQEKDAFEACLSAAGLAHAAHPHRRMVIGPLPSDVVSTATLIGVAREHNINIEVDRNDIPFAQVFAPRSGSRRRRGLAGLSPKPWIPLSHAPTETFSPSLHHRSNVSRLPRSRSSTNASLPASPTVWRSGLSRMNTHSSVNWRQIQSNSRSRNQEAASLASRQRKDLDPLDLHTNQPTSLAENEQKHGLAPKSTSNQYMLGEFGSAKPRKPSTFLDIRPSDPLRTVSYFSSHSVPPSATMHRDSDYPKLDPSMKEDLEASVSIIVGNARMIGDSFMIGDLFWTTLKNETLKPTQQDTSPMNREQDAFIQSPRSISHAERSHARRNFSWATYHQGQNVDEDDNQAVDQLDKWNNTADDPVSSGYFDQKHSISDAAAHSGLPTKTPKPLGSPVALPVQGPLVDRLEHMNQPKDEHGHCIVDASSAPSLQLGDSEQDENSPQEPPAAVHYKNHIAQQTYDSQQEPPTQFLTRSADRPARNPSILRRSKVTQDPSNQVSEHVEDTIESRQNWNKTRDELQRSVTRSRVRAPQPSHVMQELERSIEQSVRKLETLHLDRETAQASDDENLDNWESANESRGEEHDMLATQRHTVDRTGDTADSLRPSPSSAAIQSNTSWKEAQEAARDVSPDPDTESLESILPDSNVATLVPEHEQRNRNETVNGIQRAMQTFAAKNSLRPERRVRFSNFFHQESDSDFSSISTREEVPEQLAASGDPVPVGAGDRPPTEPSRVLARESEPAVPVSSMHQQAKAEKSSRHIPMHKPELPILKRDRMLVKIQHAPHHTVSESFNALEARKYELRTLTWAEFMVVLRPGRLELWSEGSIRGRIFGTTSVLKLRHVAILKKGQTSVSLYSEIDRLICLTFPRSIHKQAITTRSRLFRRHGSAIWVLRSRDMTTATDWMWILYRELGGSIPTHLYVHIPAISVRIRLPVHELPRLTELSGCTDSFPDLFQGTSASLLPANHLPYMALTSTEIIMSVKELVDVIPNWANLADRMRLKGIRPKLSWRSGMILNWVDSDVTIHGQPRYWSVLVGRLLTMQPQQQPVLELLPSAHYPAHAQHPNGNRLEEPAGLEGVVWRLRAVSNAVNKEYFSTQESRVYIMRVSRAFAPDPHEGVPLDTEIESPAMTQQERLEQHCAAFHAREQARQQLQLRYCEGFLDLNEVVAMRSPGTGAIITTDLTRTATEMAAHVFPDAPEVARAPEKSPEVHTLYDYDGSCTQLESLLSYPMEDEAMGVGDEVLQRAKDRYYVRALRRVDLLMANGRCFSFECASGFYAREWLIRLYQIAVYWRCRRKTDIWLLSSFHHQITPSAPPYLGSSERLTDEQQAEGLRVLWNWCVMDGCQPSRCYGWLYWKTHNSHNFELRYFMVCGGALVMFKMAKSMRTATSRQNEGVLYRRLEPPILLRDAYIYTGRISDRMTKSAAANAANIARRETYPGVGGEQSLPRLYSDGLTTYDDDDDCLFALRIRAGNDAFSAQQNRFRLQTRRPLDTGEYIPGLADKTCSEILFRAKSVVDRDAWVRAIEVEIENLARTEPERETLVRERGYVP
ncbi:hypothetical protein MYAM1_003413 [Malassezia yamatoensis]|uniref:PH domain-containing protein n=1 Tax=Malassezia yamatoensis TaxID=253288 RepID=A0AAJ6CKE9_9BASI|nr:hypothetical protein MYAM1_003413 [Malassezia yamatoensis]